MARSHSRESLKKFEQTVKRLDLNKRVAAAKWLEGVILAQSLTTEEREDMVKAANEYVESVPEEEYIGAVNALIEFLERVQRNSKRALKRAQNKRPVVSHAPRARVGAK